MFSKLRKTINSLFKTNHPKRKDYRSPTLTETLLAIDELNTLVQNDIDAIEIYLALASLYRVQGDIERSLQIHARLLVRSELTPELKARIYAELGKDYKRAGLLDRALSAFMYAKKLMTVNDTFLYELLDLYDIMKDYQNASLIAHTLSEPLIEAYYIAQQVDKNNLLSPLNKKILNKSITIAPDLIIAWSFKLRIAILQMSTTSIKNVFINALKNITKPFLFLEEIISSKEFQDASPELQEFIVETIASILSEYPEDFLIYYYIGRFYLFINQKEKAKEVFLQSFSLKDDFWATHYELFSLTMPRKYLTTEVLPHVIFFHDTGKRIKRFSCNICTLTLNSLFHICPRCKHIQSLRFRTILEE